MTNCASTILIQPFSLTSTESAQFKQQLARLDWGVLLESASRDHPDSRWSIYSAQPIATIQTRDQVSTIVEQTSTTTHQDDPFSLIESLRKSLFAPQTCEQQLPFTGGALGYIGYELGYQLETINHAQHPQGLDLPDLAIGFYDWALINDQQTEQIYLVVQQTAQSNLAVEQLWQERAQWITELIAAGISTTPFSLTSDWTANLDSQSYQQKFKQVQNYIVSGDCYQINLTQRFQAHYQGDEYSAYQALLVTNQPPFAAFMRLPEQVILSLSPERFIKLTDQVVETKPIKGTRPRYQDPQQDLQSQQALLSSEKDRAENLMIVDLLRNDIGRVCQPASVTVPKLFAIESFPAVHHLVSTVIGKLAPQYSSEALLRACFPGGSITGAPKIRAMEIIAELEPNKRHIYCGSIGYINGNGNLDMNIGIRTLVCHQRQIYCWAGGGLVADSDPEQEYQECFDKVSKILPCLAALNK